ncbi:hypothetical protein ACFLY1_01070 [Patescibacteria group bacterium]
MSKRMMEMLLRGANGFPGGPDDIEGLEKMFGVESRPKTHREIELDAAMTGKKSEINYLHDCVKGYCERIAELTKALDKKKAANEELSSELVRAKRMLSKQSEVLEKKEKHIANIAEGKSSCTNKLLAINDIISNADPITTKTLKDDLLKIVNGVKAAL